MTIQNVSQDDIETFTIVTNPSQNFVSSSQGVVGSVFVFPRRSEIEKDLQSSPTFLDQTKDDANLTSYLNDLILKSKTGTNILQGVLNYLTGVNEQSVSSRKFVSKEIQRSVPSVDLSDMTLQKLMMKDNLMPFYRSSSPSYHYGFTNYNSLNFFTASTVREDAVFLFPSISKNRNNGFTSGCYVPTGAFSFDFYINPRYTTDSPDGDFRAGTLFHLSSTYAVSLITGSSKDYNGHPNTYRVMLQLSHSADVAPSLAIPGIYDDGKDLIFLSDDNSLKRNNWHHVVIRWGTNLIDHGSGSFVIDGNIKGTFNIPSSTIAPSTFINSSNTDVLCVGNYYEGSNVGTSAMATWFAEDPATRDGLTELLPGTGIEYPSVFAFTHPLNAEVHDLKIKQSFITNNELSITSGNGQSDLTDTLFYWPPFFTEQSPYRKFVGDHGGVLQTPFFAIDGTTIDPFNIALSFGVAGHYPNLENYGLDFASLQYPRMLALTASEITTSTSALTTNDFFYETPDVRRRNVTILPCDDGNFIPNYDLISNFSTSSIKYVDALNSYTPGQITLDNLVPESLLFQLVQTGSGAIFDHLAGATPSNYGIEPGEMLTVFQRTQDPSSNEIVMFEISNLFFGNRILPKSFVITDNAITGTNGKLSITIKDDGNGNLYRADCETKNATWNSIGNIFYNEGLVLIKTPMIPFFGQDQFEISFKGEQNIHTMRLNVVIPSMTLNSSSNPTYIPLSSSLSVNQEEQGFVYITGMNFHDENLNVIMKTQFAQPLTKKFSDKYLIKVRTDF